MRWILLSVAAGSTLIGEAAAQRAGSFYVQGQAGYFGSTTDEIEVISQGIAGETRATTELDYESGYAVGGLVGYHLSPRFSVEGEVTFRSTNINGFEIVEPGGDAVEGTEKSSIDTMAFMGNFVYRMAEQGAFTPYLGAGVGYATIDSESGFDFDGAFAYQFKAGLEYPVNTRSALSVEAGYFGTSGFELDEELIKANFDYGGLQALVTYKVRFGALRR